MFLLKNSDLIVGTVRDFQSFFYGRLKSKALWQTDLS